MFAFGAGYIAFKGKELELTKVSIDDHRRDHSLMLT